MIDHPIEGDVVSKDTTDAAAGAYYNCISNPPDTTDSLDNPAIVPNVGLAGVSTEAPPIIIELPPWRRKSRRFVSSS
jgi:hypothetical protein